MAAADTLDGVAKCRVVRGDAEVGPSPWAERSRAIVQWCADQLTALLTATLTAVLTEELADGFFGLTITEWKGLRAPAAHSNTHSNTHSTTHSTTHRTRSQPCE